MIQARRRGRQHRVRGHDRIQSRIWLALGCQPLGRILLDELGIRHGFLGGGAEPPGIWRGICRHAQTRGGIPRDPATTDCACSQHGDAFHRNRLLHGIRSGVGGRAIFEVIFNSAVIQLTAT
jgi:hypothetical protein